MEEAKKSDIRIFKYLLIFTFGVILLINGVMTVIFNKAFHTKVSDEYVINRAKELGYVEAREAIIQNIENTKKAEEEKKSKK